MIPDEFRTIREEVRSELREQASRFLSIAFPTSSRDDAEARLSEIRKEYFDATHHCYAYRIIGDDVIERSSDGGEPLGTAGRPILQAIEKIAYFNVCVAVVRWFGGTKLGTGGLVRAYGTAAGDALQCAGIRRCAVVTPVSVHFPHADTNAVMHTIARYEAKIHSTNYGNDVTLTVLLRRDQLDAFSSAMVDATRGNAAVDIGTERMII